MNTPIITGSAALGGVVGGIISNSSGGSSGAGKGLMDWIFTDNSGGANNPPGPKDVPTVDWGDPSKPPKGADGADWEWRGRPPQGGDKGGYVNPSNPDQSAHPDFAHPAPIGPHWDFTDRNKTPPGWRIFPDGSIKPK